MSDTHALTGAYALDALDDVERASYERHLRGCAACADEVDGFREAAARLADPLETTPPPALRERILAEVARTPQQARSHAGARRPVRSVLASAVAAVVGLILVGGAVAYGLGQHREAQQMAAEKQEMTSVISARDASMSSTPVSGGGNLRVIRSSDEDKGVAILAGLPELPDDRAYQLWTLAGSAATSAGVVAREDEGATSVHMVGSVRGVTAVAVTVEPAGGSKQPTTNPLAALPLS